MPLGPQKVLIRRTATPDNPPTGLLPGELSVEMADPLRLWVGVPVAIDATGKRLLNVPLIVVGDNPPAVPGINQLWWESDTGILWLWYSDGTSAQWVEVSRSGGDIEPVETDADQITFTPGGGLSADDVQEALMELDTEKVAKAGDTMTGPLVLSGAPTLDGHAVNKLYVDTVDAALTASLATKIGDAPSNGNVYARQDAAWVIVPSGAIPPASGIVFTPAGNIGAIDVQAAIEELDTEKVAKAGDTMSGNLTIKKGTPALVLVKTGDPGCQIWGYRDVAGVNTARWNVVLASSAGELGANSGSDFVINRFDDAGAALTSPLNILRATGQVSTLLPILPATSWTVAQQLAARQAIYAAPFDAMAFNGLMVNGNFQVSQDYGTSNLVLTPGVNGYACDTAFMGGMATAAGLGYIINQTQSGAYSLLTTNCQATGTLVASSANGWNLNIEADRCARLQWGTAAAQPISVGFWAFSNTTGILPIAFRNSAGDRSYVTTITINAINTWEYKTLLIPGDTTGTWLYTAGSIGLRITIGLCVGTTFQAASLNTWSAGNFLSHSSVTLNIGINGRILYSRGIQIWPGSAVPLTEEQFFNAMRPFSDELLLVKRYLQRSYAYGTIPGTVTNAGCERRGTLSFNTTQASATSVGVRLPVQMRAAPTIAIYNPGTGTVNSGNVFTPGLNSSGTPSVANITPDSFAISLTAVTPVMTANVPAEMTFHWAADARL